MFSLPGLYTQSDLEPRMTQNLYVDHECARSDLAWYLRRLGVRSHGTGVMVVVSHVAGVVTSTRVLCQETALNN